MQVLASFLVIAKGLKNKGKMGSTLCVLFKFCFVVIVSYIFLVWNNKAFDPDELVGKNILVTGASSGIGKGVAIQYAKYGANVFITARREKQLQEVVALCKEVGRENAKFGYVTADMQKYAEETKLVVKEATQFLGGLDHVILNHVHLQLPEAQEGWTGTAEQLDNLEAQIDTGLLSFVHLTAHALPYLRKSNTARIGVTGSIAGKTTARSLISYCSVKFGLDGFFSSLRELFEHDGTNIPITYYVIGPVDVERQFKPPLALLLNAERLRLLLSGTTVEPTAEEIVKATTRGDAELYYPHLFGFIPGGYRIFPILRHIKHNLLYMS